MKKKSVGAAKLDKVHDRIAALEFLTLFIIRHLDKKRVDQVIGDLKAILDDCEKSKELAPLKSTLEWYLRWILRLRSTRRKHLGLVDDPGSL